MRNKYPRYILCLYTAFIYGCENFGSDLRQINDPIEIAPIIHCILNTGDVNISKPYLFCDDDITKIVKKIYKNDSAHKAKDAIVKALIHELEKATTAARQQYDFRDSHIMSYDFGRTRIMNNLWSLADTYPTEVVENLSFVVELKEGHKKLSVQVGDLYHISGRWKLDGWFIIQEVK